jgi:large subunit ribosomal protein L23
MLIERPIVTEKGTALKESMNRYVFRVDLRANKMQIKKAVESLFGVKVLNVRTAVYRGKHVVIMNRSGRYEGYKSNWKKAFVTLAPGENIDIFDVV